MRHSHQPAKSLQIRIKRAEIKNRKFLAESLEIHSFVAASIFQKRTKKKNLAYIPQPSTISLMPGPSLAKNPVYSFRGACQTSGEQISRPFYFAVGVVATTFLEIPRNSIRNFSIRVATMQIKHAGARLISRNAAAGFSARPAHSSGVKHAQVGLTRAPR